MSVGWWFVGLVVRWFGGLVVRWVGGSVGGSMVRQVRSFPSILCSSK